MSHELPILNQISIPEPCPVSWDTMSGDEQERHCSQCEKSVFHLSEMTREEAEQTVRGNSGQMCVRIRIRESDGHVLTKDDGDTRRVGWLRRSAKRCVGALLALPLLCFLPGCGRDDLPKPVADWFLPQPEAETELMGDVVVVEEMGMVAVGPCENPTSEEAPE